MAPKPVHNPKNGSPVGMGGKHLPVGEKVAKTDKAGLNISTKPFPAPKGR